MTGVIATAALVGVPALLRVDRALAPLQSVFLALADRQRYVLNDIEILDRRLKAPAGARAEALPLSQREHSARVSVLSVYGGILGPAATRKLAVAEDELDAIESAFGEAVARYERGDRAGAAIKLGEIRGAEDQSQQRFTEVMVLALNSGRDARRAFQQSVRTLAWAAGAWMVIGGLLLLTIGYDVNRNIWMPLRALDARVREIAAGNWSHPVRVDPGDELGELAEQFNALTEALQRGAGQHAQLATAGELLAGVAHELNNPLQAIHGTAELRSSAEPANRDWATVRVQAERASKLVRDLVQFVTPASQDVKLLAPNDVVRQAVNLVEFQYRADGIGLELDLASGLPSVRCDAHELVQVIVNLLGNAHGFLKETTGPKRVFVRTWTDSGRVYFRVLDTGPGIRPDIQERMFSPFFSTKAVGVGLGLTVSRNLVRGAEGDLSFDPEEPGASFTFWLPARVEARSKPVVREQPMPRPKALAGITILVADDEEAIRSVLERFFSRDGATVVVAGGGVAALEAIRRQPIDVVVLDVRMPDLDGASVYRAILKERPDLASKVIFLSGDVSRVADEVGISRDRVLVKPIELGDLKRVVANLV